MHFTSKKYVPGRIDSEPMERNPAAPAGCLIIGVIEKKTLGTNVGKDLVRPGTGISPHRITD